MFYKTFLSLFQKVSEVHKKRYILLIFYSLSVFKNQFLNLYNVKKTLQTVFEYRRLIYFLKIYFLLFTIPFSFKAFPDESHGSHYSEKEIETALEVFEKAMLLSPDLLDKIEEHSVVPFYKINGHKIYLNEGFWDLTRAWLRYYIGEINKDCPCDLDPDLMIQEAKDYLPQSFVKQKILNSAGRKGQETVEKLTYKGTLLVAEFGYPMIVLQLSAEVAESFLGVHLFCTVINVAIVTFMRSIQKYLRVFSYRRQLSSSGLSSAAKMAWISQKVNKSKRRVFFHIEQALVFREQELEKVNEEGPKSLFHRRGHRLLWIEKLKRKTDSLFEQIAELELQLENENLSPREQSKIIKKIRKQHNKIENISKVNRKDFFGSRFKRFLALRSRKGRVAYIQGKHLEDKVTGKGLLWPISLQENIIERSLVSSSVRPAININPDEIRDGLIEEFLLAKRETDEISKSELNETKQAAQFFLTDIEQIFNPELPQVERLMRVYAIENVLGTLFAHYLDMSASNLSHKYGMSFKEKIRLYWIFGKYFHAVHDFSDALSSIAITKNKTKIKFYKYESMEKLFAFLDYLYEIQLVLKDSNIDKQAVFERFKSLAYNLRSLSLLREKKTAFSLIPFKKAVPQCKKLVEKYQ